MQTDQVVPDAHRDHQTHVNPDAVRKEQHNEWEGRKIFNVFSCTRKLKIHDVIAAPWDDQAEGELCAQWVEERTHADIYLLKHVRRLFCTQTIQSPVSCGTRTKKTTNSIPPHSKAVQSLTLLLALSLLPSVQSSSFLACISECLPVS